MLALFFPIAASEYGKTTFQKYSNGIFAEEMSLELSELGLVYTWLKPLSIYMAVIFVSRVPKEWERKYPSAFLIMPHPTNRPETDCAQQLAPIKKSRQQLSELISLGFYNLYILIMGAG